MRESLSHHYMHYVKSNFMILSSCMPSNVALITRETADLKMKRQEQFIAWLCECSVSSWPLDYADLTVMLAVSHGLPYANHRVSDTDTGHCYPGISQSL